jgi:hypothetical protein
MEWEFQSLKDMLQDYIILDVKPALYSDQTREVVQI